MMTIDFYDEEDTYGRIETEEKTERIEELLNEYRNSNQEDYNVDDFFEFLKSKNIDFTQINLEADVSYLWKLEKLTKKEFEETEK